MFYRTLTATTRRQDKKVTDFDKVCKVCGIRYPEFSPRPLLASKCDMLEHKCMCRFIFLVMFRKIIGLFNGRKF